MKAIKALKRLFILLAILTATLPARSHLLAVQADTLNKAFHFMQPKQLVDPRLVDPLLAPNKLPSISASVPCEDAIVPFAAELGEHQNPETYAQIGDALKDPKFANAAAAYQKNCFENINSLPTYAKTSGIAQFIGSLQIGESALPFCSAIFVASHTLLTARHCFFSDETGEPLYAQSLSSSIVFRPFANQAKEYHAQLENDTGTSGFSAFDDHLLLTTKEAYLGAPLLQIGKISAGDQLATVGVFIYTLKRSVLLSDGGECKVVAALKGCFTYGCQTTPGFSGGPLISISSSASPKLVGIHIGSTRDGQCADHDEGTLNYGITVQAIGNLQ